VTARPDSLPPEVDDALARLDDLVTFIETHPDATVQDAMLEMLRAVDVIHRGALQRVRALLEARALLDEALQDPHVGLLFELYDDQADAEWERVEAALERVRPAIESHGGRLEIVAAEGGVVNVQLLGACESCSASSAALRDLVEQALRAELPEFVRLDVSQPAAHPAPPVLIPASSLLRRGVVKDGTSDA
jgi:Fe-S cluster biogenesis protein NfuA